LEIAKWLVAKRDFYGMYNSFTDSALAVKSLHAFRKLFGTTDDVNMSLIQEVHICSGSWKNESNGEYYSLVVSKKTNQKIHKQKYINNN